MRVVLFSQSTSRGWCPFQTDHRREKAPRHANSGTVVGRAKEMQEFYAGLWEFMNSDRYDGYDDQGEPILPLRRVQGLMTPLKPLSTCCCQMATWISTITPVCSGLVTMTTGIWSFWAHDIHQTPPSPHLPRIRLEARARSLGTYTHRWGTTRFMERSRSPCTSTGGVNTWLMSGGDDYGGRQTVRDSGTSSGAGWTKER